MVRSPRFEPGSSAWQADVLDQTRLRPHFTRLGLIVDCNLLRCLFAFLEQHSDFVLIMSLASCKPLRFPNHGRIRTLTQSVLTLDQES
jgi:hypothetical protein